MKISVLDCTLRDGGCANDFRFPADTMRGVADSIVSSDIEYIELGYLDSAKGKAKDFSRFISMQAVTDTFGPRDPNGLYTRLVMVDYGKFDPADLPQRSAETTDGIRFCFHKKNASKALQEAAAIASKGYEIFIQPMLTTRYTDLEFARLIEDAQRLIPSFSALYIVDSFGEMDVSSVIKRVELADKVMVDSKLIGLHTHNNLGLCFAHAQAVSTMLLSHDLIIDGTLMGMGKGAGNLPTERVASYLNGAYSYYYDTARLEEAARKYIEPLASECFWGDSDEYRLSAEYSVTPTYIKMIMRKLSPDIGTLEKIISQIPDDRRDAFDADFARILCEKFCPAKEGC